MNTLEATASEFRQFDKRARAQKSKPVTGSSCCAALSNLMQASEELDHAQEPTIAEQIEAVQVENADQPMDAESDAVNEQLALLQAIPELMEKVTSLVPVSNAHLPELILMLYQPPGSAC